MKSIRFLIFCVVFAFLILQISTYSSSSGVTNSTRKYGPNGCGCHAGAYTNAEASVKVIIKGPDSPLDWRHRNIYRYRFRRIRIKVGDKYCRIKRCIVYQRLNDS